MTGGAHFATVEQLIRSALPEVERLIGVAFEAVGGPPPAGSALDQNGLLDGGAIVTDFLDHHEFGCALDHLIYMVVEPGLVVSNQAYGAIVEAGRLMGMTPNAWEQIRRPSA